MKFDAIPEELMVKEIVTNKGSSRKKVRIMGRGHTGIGMIAKTHVCVKLEVIDFEQKILEAKSVSQKKKWIAKRDLVQQLKSTKLNSAMSAPQA
jgi:hypothetical protein